MSLVGIRYWQIGCYLGVGGLDAGELSAVWILVSLVLSGCSWVGESGGLESLVPVRRGPMEGGQGPCRLGKEGRIEQIQVLLLDLDPPNSAPFYTQTA